MKVCDICQKNEASITITRVDKDGKSAEMHLCSKCAMHKGIGDAVKPHVSVIEILAELKDKIKDEDRNLVCPKCGITYADFKRFGRLGCENCYTAFAERLLPLIKRIHGSNKHIGRKPTLRDELSHAIAAEDYEKAARIRDSIKKTEEDSSEGI